MNALLARYGSIDSGFTPYDRGDGRPAQGAVRPGERARRAPVAADAHRARRPGVMTDAVTDAEHGAERTAARSRAQPTGPPRPRRGGSGRHRAGRRDRAAAIAAAVGAGSTAAGTRYPFYGAHQAGITTPAQDRLHFAAFDMASGATRADLMSLLCGLDRRRRPHDAGASRSATVRRRPARAARRHR